jgi:hypothetical protein
MFDLSLTYLDIVIQCRYIKHTFRTTVLAPSSGRRVHALYPVNEHATLYTPGCGPSQIPSIKS